jgi:AcrR family transcriptional regulator
MAQLDRNRIAATGLAVLDRRGLAGFTIRAVAKALGVTPMALYHYVKNKADLAALVVNFAHNALPLDTPLGVWREDLWAIARWTRKTVNNHSAVGELRRTYRIYSPEIVRMAERWLSIWQQSGLPLKKAVAAARVSSVTIAGLVMEEAILRNLDKPDDALLARLPNARLMYESERDPESAYELAVRSLIDGLHFRLTNDGRSMSPRGRRRSSPRRAKR